MSAGRGARLQGLAQCAPQWLQWPRKSCAVALALALAATGAPAAERPRVASLNLCTDQLLLAIADPEQIVGLGPYSRDAARSWAADRAAAHRVLSGTGEEIVFLKPDLVLSGRPTPQATGALLRATGFRVEEFEPVRSIEEARAQIRRVGDLVGHPARAAALVAAIDSAVARTQRAAAGTPLRVLSVQRRGWVAGQDSLTSSLLATAGLANAAAELGLSAGALVPLEGIVKARPDLILVAGSGAEDQGQAAEDQGQAMLLHPALARLYPPQKRILVPERLTVCGGPMLAEALDRLAAQIERVVAPERRAR